MKKFAVALCLVSTPAASCNVEDLAGNWNMLFEDYSCQLTVAADGKIGKGQCAQMALTPDATATRSPARGRLKMLANCRVTGSFNMTNRAGTRLKVSISQSRLGLDNLYWQGLLSQQNLDEPFDFGPVFGGSEGSDAGNLEYSNFSAVAY